MDSRHCCVCGQKIRALDVYVWRVQGKICSQCILEREIPVGGRISRAALRRGEWYRVPQRLLLAPTGA